MPFEIGTKIQVDITARVNGVASYSPDRLAITAVADKTTYAWNHFLYLNSPSITGEKEFGGTVRAVFEAEVTGTFQASPQITTEVRETKLGYTHYLYLNSSEITVISEIQPAPAPVTSKKKEKTTMSIDRYDTTITSQDVDDRIEELEDSQGYEVIRVRNDEVLASFSDEDEARQYIEDEDYNPERVVVRQEELDEEDTNELSSLRDLRNSAESTLSAPWTIYNEDYFDSDWARGEAREVLGSGTDLKAWPLADIDWDEAASSRRDDLYPTCIEFDGRDFYADED